MKILMINYEYPPLGGGGGVFNKQLAEELCKNHEITVITSRFGNQKPRERINGIEIIRVPVMMRTNQNKANLLSMLFFFPTSIITGYQLLKKRKYDLIHSFFAIPSAPSGMVLARRFKIPHLLSLLGGDVYDPSKRLSPHKTPLLRQTVKKMMEGSEKVIALSTDVKGRAIKYYKVKNELELIHLGIPKPKFKEVSRERFQLNQNDTLLITIGRLVARKGLEDMIEVIHKIQDTGLKLIIIGEGPKRGDWEPLARSYDVEEQIIFTGNISDEDKLQLLSLSDIYVSSSRHEGFGIVFLEAMAAGLPVITYDKGGQTDFLIDGKTGYLVPVNDKAQLKDRIEKLMDSDDLRDRMKAHNRRYIENFFIENTASRYHEQYLEVLNRAA